MSRLVLLHRSCLLALLIGLAGCTSIERLAIPEVEPLPTPFDAVGTRSVLDVAAWDAFLERYTRLADDGSVRVAYAVVTPTHRAELARWLDEQQALDPTTRTRDAQLAYWINLYNARTVALILEHYPVASIRDIRSSLVDVGPWEDHRLTVGGQALSLHDVEHRIVRAQWPEVPEIHYALNCAAIGCPDLGRSAYRAEDIELALARAARRYVNDDRGVRIDDAGRARLSRIYAWYREDFGDDHEGLRAHLLRHAEAALAERLAAPLRISGYDYDWALNDADADAGAAR